MNLLKLILLFLFVVLAPLCSLADEAQDKAAEAFLIQSGLKAHQEKLQNYVYQAAVKRTNKSLVDTLGFVYFTLKTRTVNTRFCSVGVVIGENSASLSIPF